MDGEFELSVSKNLRRDIEISYISHRTNRHGTATKGPHEGRQPRLTGKFNNSKNSQIL